MTKHLKRYLLLAIFIGGYVSLSLEIIAMRQLMSFVGSTAITASIVIGVFLAFLSIGYYQGSVSKISTRRLKDILWQGFTVIAALIIFATSYPLLDAYFSFLTKIGIRSNILQTFIYSFMFLSFGPFLFGLITATTGKYVQRSGKDETGTIMAVDTIGSVFGSILTTLIFMPFIGVNHTIIWITAVSLFGAFLFKRSYEGLLILVFGIVLNANGLLEKNYGMVSNNAASTIILEEQDEGKSILMKMNGGHSSKISEDEEQMFHYIRIIENNFILPLREEKKGVVKEKKKILILGAGGFTLGLKDHFNDYTFVDIDKDLKKITEEKFLKQKLGENKKFVLNDASQFLKTTEEKYDLIVLDTYSSKSMIPENLVTIEYFKRVKDRVNEGGIVVINIITSPNFSDPFSQRIDNTIRHVFTKNLSRDSVGEWFNAFAPNDNKKNMRNILYTFYNIPNDGMIYSNGKNQSFYDW